MHRVKNDLKYKNDCFQPLFFHSYSDCKYNTYSFHNLISLAFSYFSFKKSTAYQILHQEPVLLLFYVWSLLTRLYRADRFIS